MKYAMNIRKIIITELRRGILESQQKQLKENFNNRFENDEENDEESLTTKSERERL